MSENKQNETCQRVSDSRLERNDDDTVCCALPSGCCITVMMAERAHVSGTAGDVDDDFAAVADDLDVSDNPAFNPSLLVDCCVSTSRQMHVTPPSPKNCATATSQYLLA